MSPFEAFRRPRGAVLGRLRLAPSVCSLLVVGCAAAHTPPQDPQAAIGEDIPGYGGHFIDDSGAPVVYLSDPSGRDIALSVLAPSLRGRGVDPARLRAAQADYDHGQLLEWFSISRNAVAASGAVVFVDLDEARQRIHVGVDGSAEERAAIERRLLGRGIPPPALAVEPAAPFEPLASLVDTVRPPIGGLALNVAPFAGPSCTLGFNVAGGLPAFVTNSHCTRVQGGEEASRFGQAPVGQGIGVEASDPDYTRAGHCPCERRLLVCLRRARCRYSDSARVAYTPGVDPELGAIARTQRRDPVNGSREIEGAFRIVAEVSDPLQGQTLHKVGAVTGWTFGEVSRTCFDARHAASGFWHVCQSAIDAGGAQGDSGSPVFGVADSARGEVALYGVLWGGNGDEVVFSPMSGIERELGDLVVVAPHQGVLPDLIALASPGSSGPQGFCRRSASGDLLVRVVNQSNVDVLTRSTTRVRFATGETADLATPPMPAGGGANLAVAIPSACAPRDCGFQITVDANDDIQEGASFASPAEANNIHDGLCIG